MLRSILCCLFLSVVRVTHPSTWLRCIVNSSVCTFWSTGWKLTWIWHPPLAGDPSILSLANSTKSVRSTAFSICWKRAQIPLRKLREFNCDVTCIDKHPSRKSVENPAVTRQESVTKICGECSCNSNFSWPCEMRFSKQVSWSMREENTRSISGRISLSLFKNGLYSSAERTKTVWLPCIELPAKVICFVCKPW